MEELDGLSRSLNSPNNNELDRLSRYRYLAIATIADVTFTLVDVINYNNYSICVLYIERLHYVSRVDNKKIKVSQVDFITTVACLPY